MTTIKLDFDKKIRWGRDRFLNVIDMLRLEVRNLRVYETTRGLHVTFETPRKLENMDIVCLQSLLGSDWKRETYNFIRVRNLRKNSHPFFSKHWNVLYRKKYEYADDKIALASREERRKDIEEDLIRRIKEMKEAWKYADEVEMGVF